MARKSDEKISYIERLKWRAMVGGKEARKGINKKQH